MNNIIEIIDNEDLSLDELSEILKETLAKMYTKLENDIGLRSPIGVITSLGEESYHVNVKFMSSESYDGESYETVYNV